AVPDASDLGSRPSLSLKARLQPTREVLRLLAAQLLLRHPSLVSILTLSLDLGLLLLLRSGCDSLVLGVQEPSEVLLVLTLLVSQPQAERNGVLATHSALGVGRAVSLLQLSVLAHHVADRSGLRGQFTGSASGTRRERLSARSGVSHPALVLVQNVVELVRG